MPLRHIFLLLFSLLLLLTTAPAAPRLRAAAMAVNAATVLGGVTAIAAISVDSSGGYVFVAGRASGSGFVSKLTRDLRMISTVSLRVSSDVLAMALSPDGSIYL